MQNSQNDETASSLRAVAAIVAGGPTTLKRGKRASIFANVRSKDKLKCHATHHARFRFLHSVQAKRARRPCASEGVEEDVQERNFSSHRWQEISEFADVRTHATFFTRQRRLTGPKRDSCPRDVSSPSASSPPNHGQAQSRLGFQLVHCSPRTLFRGKG